MLKVQITNNGYEHGSVFVFTETWIDCPGEWLRFRETCYLFVRSPQLTWPEAQHYCSEYFAAAVSIEDSEEHDFVSNHLRNNDATLSV